MGENSFRQVPYRRYNIAFRPACDITDGMRLLRSKIYEKLFEARIAVQPLTPYTKSSYGVYDGQRNIIGRMFNYEVVPDKQQLEMSEATAEIMALRASNAYQALNSAEFREIVSNAMEKQTNQQTNNNKIKTT